VSLALTLEARGQGENSGAWDRFVLRRGLLRPDPATNNAFLYCLIAAAVRCEIDVLLPGAMSNHHL
jgi:hypothetical protein